MPVDDDPEPGAPPATGPASRVMTRRRVIVGGAVAAGAAVAGGWLAVERSSPVRRRLHAAGLLDGPDRPVPAGSSAGTVAYARLDGPDGHRYPWGLWTPPGAAPSLCLVCLHAKGGDERFAFDALGVHRFVADAGLPWAVATIDGGTGYWHPRTDGTDPGGAVTGGLLPTVAGRLPGGLPFALLGWSMGGYGALLLGPQSPDAVTAVVAASPAVWTSFGDAAPGAFDGGADFRAHDVLAGAADRAPEQPARIDCGADDAFAGTSRRLLATVPGAAGGIHPGFHDEGTWRSFLPAQLRWLRSVT
jgi:Putative esterase